MRVSIIVPVYNVSDYIERCVRSVMAQSYTDLECIIVDDCTPDDSIEKCERMIAEYNGPIEFKILHHERNRGLSAARNTGTDAATGEYIYYLDSDDEITPKCIEILEREVEKHPEVELVQGNLQSVPYKECYDLLLYKTPRYVEDNNWIRYCFFCCESNFPVNAWNKLVKRSFLYKNGLFFKEGLIHEDELWTFFVVKKVQKVSVVGDVTCVHYTTDNSIMSTTNKERSARHWGVILDCVSRHFDQPFRILLLSKYLFLFLYWFSFAPSSWDFWKAMPHFVWALLREGKERLAMRFFFYIVLYPIHHGDWDFHQIKWSSWVLWQSASKELEWVGK